MVVELKMADVAEVRLRNGYQFNSQPSLAIDTPDWNSTSYWNVVPLGRGAAGCQLSGMLGSLPTRSNAHAGALATTRTAETGIVTTGATGVAVQPEPGTDPALAAPAPGPLRMTPTASATTATSAAGQRGFNLLESIRGQGNAVLADHDNVRAVAAKFLAKLGLHVDVQIHHGGRHCGRYNHGQQR